jgi:phosphoglycolate phosphatase
VSRYRLAIFDFDGTLADSFGWFAGVFNDVADRYGFRRTEAHEVNDLRGRGAREVLARLGIPAWKLPLIARHIRLRMARDIDRIKPFPGTDAMLRGLAARGVRLAVVSSNSAANVRHVLGPDLAPLIHHYGCGASIFGKRPKLRAACRAAGVAPAETLCIGDELRDLWAARAEGIPFGAVSWGYTTPEVLRSAGPEEVFTSAEEILTVFGRAGD